MQKKFLHCAIIFSLLYEGLLFADFLDWNVLQKTNIPFKPSEMMKEYLNTLAVTYLKSFEENPTRFPEKENLETYKNERRELYWSLLGGKPKPTPLNPVLIRKGRKSTYKYEVLYFESQPHLYVSTVLFLPLSQPPYPCVLVPCGHSQEAKGYAEYQKLCILLAQNGIASLIYDPPGQGERITYLKEDGSPDVWGIAEHTIVGLGCILLGENYALYEIWDGIRAIDYLETRDDIQKDKIGCSGSSGGGTQTAYLMALEPRIYASAPSCYLTSWERLLNTIGPQDAEQNIFSQIKHGCDHSEYVFMHAPNPVLICSATKDFFDITGTWATFRTAKRLYAKLGVNNMCDLIEVDDQHGLGNTQREEIVERMLLWLCGVNRNVDEQISDTEILSKEEYQVCNGGNIREIPNSKTIIDINREKEKQLKSIRNTNWNTLTLEQKKSKVREVINVEEWRNIPEPKINEINPIEKRPIPEAKSITPIVINPEEGVYLPGYLFEAKQPTLKIVIYTHPEGKNKDIDLIRSYLKNNIHVCAIDIRGTGETAPVASKNDITNTVGSGWEDYFRAYLIGKSYVGMRVFDYFSIIKYLKKKFGDKIDISIHTEGILCVPALHTTFLMLPERIKLHLKGLISWSDIIENPRIQGQITNAVHGVLKWYDIPQLVSELDNENIKIINEESSTF